MFIALVGLRVIRDESHELRCMSDEKELGSTNLAFWDASRQTMSVCMVHRGLDGAMAQSLDRQTNNMAA